MTQSLPLDASLNVQGQTSLRLHGDFPQTFHNPSMQTAPYQRKRCLAPFSRIYPNHL